MQTRLQNVLIILAVVLVITPVAPRTFQTAPPSPAPLEIARILAAKYPAQPIMSYIPALAWSSQLRLSAMTGDPQWREKALKNMRPFVSGGTPPIATPYRLTSLAGALAFHDAWTMAGDQAALKVAMEVAAFMVVSGAGPDIKFATGWTDDMFMASAVLSRAGLAPHADAVHQLLVGYAKKLQRADGLFMHAEKGPHAWGRGNGFALLGVTDALARWPDSWAGRAPVLEIYRRHVAALAKHQSDDGAWRQVVDEPASYRELTVTAMTVAAMARGISRGWIDRATYAPIVSQGWRAVAARVNADGTVRDVCSGTGAGETKEYYLTRPVVNGADDRGGAMALLAAIEMALIESASR